MREYTVTFHPCYLSTWLKKEPGALLVAMERAQLERLLQPMTGNFLIQIGGRGISQGQFYPL